MEGAVRLFAGEWNRSTLAVPGGNERDTAWVVTPTGAYCRQVFLAGALVEIQEQGDMLTARLADPTGGFDLVIGGAKTPLAESVRRIPLPSFVSVGGRAQLYRSSGKPVLTIRPEQIRIIDRQTRDQWIITTGSATLTRLEAMLPALQEKSPDLRIRQALQHYSLTTENLISLAEMVEGALSSVRPARDEESTREEDPRDMILDYIRLSSGPRGVAVEEIIGMARAKGVSQDAVLSILGTLITDDECYQPQKGFVKLL